MRFLNDMLEKTKNFKWYDFSILKLSVFAFALLIAKLWSPILGLNTWWYFVVFAVTYLYLLVKIFK